MQALLNAAMLYSYVIYKLSMPSMHCCVVYVQRCICLCAVVFVQGCVVSLMNVRIGRLGQVCTCSARVSLQKSLQKMDMVGDDHGWNNHK